MHRVVYFSNANLDLTFSAIEAMVAKAAERNRPLQVSGALHYNGHNFLQILEGPHQALTPLYLQIRKDLRHSGVVKLAHMRISTRSYPDWGMRLYCGAPKRVGAPLETTSREGDLPTMIDAFFGLGHGAAFA
ncbi:MAG: BLUF domain-containing protein [Alphaproteobacteria bacterium]|nr:BLUF domain-containing protein [Alphaproteobacteria bacterium]MBM3624851.1 BLUF domain-containing protein [Alphaproteobacteria bacterium]